MRAKRAAWLSVGCPRGNDLSSYREYKVAERAFRADYRRSVDDFLQKMHEEIDRVAGIDSYLFCRLLNQKHHSSCREGNEMKLDEHVLRDPCAIAQGWGTTSKGVTHSY